MVNWQEWIHVEAPRILKKCGIRPGDMVIDFGSGIGDYTIPTAFLITNGNQKGKIIAIDDDKNNVNKLRKRAQKYKISEVITNILNEKGIIINVAPEIADAVLIFDVLHYFTKNERAQLYSEIYRVLVSNGLFITFPNHHKNSYPLWELANMTLNDIIDEIEALHFQLNHTWKGKLIHDHAWYTGTILSFRKK
ncbi:MAG: hypothetical protein BAJALOKI1v1_1090005 [Promethearchaeota archaeon]|nr:MAG: hypothetical protein BAJALOKI1v1_1090005 [Candidatus Lokiarchaeota archaeon]